MQILRSVEHMPRAFLAATAGLFLSLSPARAQSIDSCLIGVWEATTVTHLGIAQMPTGGEGIRVTFQADGTQITDYANMKPVEWAKGTPAGNGFTYRGSARGRISTANRVATLERIDEAGVTMQLWDSGGRRVFPVQRLPELGPGGLGSTASDNGYLCSGDMLEYKSSVARDKHPTFALRLTRVKGATPPPSPNVSITGKTWLTVTQLKDRQQDLQGAWRIDPQPQSGETWQWVSAATPGKMTAQSLKQRGSDANIIDMKSLGHQHWAGKVWVCPSPPGTCPNLCRWVDGSLDVDANNVSITGQWHAKKAKTDCSAEDENQPDDGTFTLKRLVGAGFVPIAQGKYMSLAGAPAVGDQKAQFKAAVRVVARYDGVPHASVRASADRGKLSLADKASGTYDFVAEGAGIYELRFELLGDDGQPFHVDRLRVEIPGIGGITP